MIVSVRDKDGGGYEFRADGLVQTVDVSDLILQETGSVSVECTRCTILRIRYHANKKERSSAHWFLRFVPPHPTSRTPGVQPLAFSQRVILHVAGLLFSQGRPASGLHRPG